METREWTSPLGPILLAAQGGALTGLWFRGQKYEQAGLERPFAGEEMPEADRAVLDRAEAWLERYFAGERPVIDFPLAPEGTEFQKRVWALLREIPYGETVSYGQLAARLGCPSARAVGAAVGRNPISLLIPCHRVLGADGSLTGYAGGLERKRRLLALEQGGEKGEET